MYTCAARLCLNQSPCPKLKPVSKVDKSGFLQVGTQPYGGGLWHTWFDRDLGVAGRAIVRRGEGKYSHDLVRTSPPKEVYDWLVIANVGYDIDRGAFIRAGVFRGGGALGRP